MENTVHGDNAPNSGRSQMTDGMLSKASTTAHSTVNTIAGAAEDAAKKAKPAIDKVAAMAHNAVDKAAVAAAPAAGWLEDQGHNLNVTQKKLVADTRSYISANPLKSLGFAVAAGYLLSKVLRS